MINNLAALKNIDLPIAEKLDTIASSVRENQATILQAEPGAGKTTLAPLALLDTIPANQKILVLEPRRLAARNAALRMSEIIGQPVGQLIGYQVRNERKCSNLTRIEVITEGILTRILQSDPELTDIGMIIFDEFHERSLDADLGLAFTIDVVESLRDDLKILIMSATLDELHIERILPNANIINSHGRSYPVTTEYLAPSRLKDWRSVLTVAIEKSLQQTKGNVLVFLPGVAEINQAESLIHSSRLNLQDIEICQLHGRLDFGLQKNVLSSENSKRRIILSTNIAESSLTIAGVDSVIDTGLVRVSRFEPRVGFDRLITSRISEASATQRKGRAGRLGPGCCLRLWSESESLKHHQDAEILRADLASFVLEIASWGVSSLDELSLIDKPSSGAFSQAQTLLVQLEALDEHHRITSHGKSILKFSVNPRFAHMILVAKNNDKAMACLLAAMLEERESNMSSRHSNFYLSLTNYLDNFKNNKNAKSYQNAKAIKIQFRKLLKKVGLGDNSFNFAEQTPGTENVVSRLLASAFPERVAMKRGGGYRLVNGSGAIFPEDVHCDAEFIVAIEMGGKNKEGKIFRYIEIEKSLIEAMFERQIKTVENVEWNKKLGTVKACQQKKLGAVVLSESQIANPNSEQIAQGLLVGIRQKTLKNLNWQEATLALIKKVALVRTIERFKNDFPPLNFDWLSDNIEKWLLPYLDGLSKIEQVTPALLHNAVISCLDYQQQKSLNALLPDKLSVASGSTIRIDYLSNERPVLSVKLQEMFGEKSSPKVADGEISLVVHLLSPARRPLQITEDLHSFWLNGYESVKKEMKGKYPKHPWPDDPMTATATRHTKKRMSQ